MDILVSRATCDTPKKGFPAAPMLLASPVESVCHSAVSAPPLFEGTMAVEGAESKTCFNTLEGNSLHHRWWCLSW